MYYCLFIILLFLLIIYLITQYNTSGGFASKNSIPPGELLNGVQMTLYDKNGKPISVTITKVDDTTININAIQVKLSNLQYAHDDNKNNDIRHIQSIANGESIADIYLRTTANRVSAASNVIVGTRQGPLVTASMNSKYTAPALNTYGYARIPTGMFMGAFTRNTYPQDNFGTTNTEQECIDKLPGYVKNYGGVGVSFLEGNRCVGIPRLIEPVKNMEGILCGSTDRYYNNLGSQIVNYTRDTENKGIFNMYVDPSYFGYKNPADLEKNFNFGALPYNTQAPICKIKAE